MQFTTAPPSYQPRRTSSSSLLGIDGERGFSFGVDNDWSPRRPPQGKEATEGDAKKRLAFYEKQVLAHGYDEYHVHTGHSTAAFLSTPLLPGFACAPGVGSAAAAPCRRRRATRRRQARRECRVPRGRGADGSNASSHRHPRPDESRNPLTDGLHGACSILRLRRRRHDQ